ncbi:DUF6259 domain-containing protein [Mucilaginibacter boryungensis]|uniref:DUF6259 domain-containing protein n=1 Tax=Mucilaginibacter boryungensis TaxID=768480 RepID=A0ABR9XD71_9SPHI|nr:DUF6259 domain-containing protein [Mucilaginibacter boryungensis]MBE9664924.1 hypothetical protein [Mucilaginibacter boryungensis]
MIKESFNRFQCKFYLFTLLLTGFLTATVARPPIVVINQGYRLVINSDKGTIESFQATNNGGIDDLLIPRHGLLPVFKIEFMSAPGKFQTVNSSDARKISVTKTIEASGDIIVLNFEGVGKLDVNARVTVRCPNDKPLTYWSMELDNRTAMWVGHIQFPVIEIPFDDNPTEENCGHILSSLYDGVLLGPIKPGMVAGAWRTSRRNTPETWRSTNYPRECTIQMMAYYKPTAGLYMACEDPAGTPKLVAPMLEPDGVTMVGHYPGTQTGHTKLPYEVVLGTFRGNWYSAAAIYRDWAEKQPFCAVKLADRINYPKWVLEPLVGATFPMRGQADWDPPAAINPEYTPATNALPYLDKLAAAFNAPLMPIIFNWENAGPWVQPGAFPPVGGQAKMLEFMKKAKAKGWHPMLYGNGVNWVVAQKNTGYDGMPYFKTHGGDSAIVHRWDGSTGAAVGWRTLYNTCVASGPARKMILGMTRGMAQLNPDAIQQFDQGVGAVACYSTQHGHSPVPGPWMTAAFTSLLKQDNETARSVNPKVAISSEGAPPEVYLQSFDFWDARTGGGGEMMCPLYSFVYHQYLNGHSGSYTNSVNDEALRAFVARALVSGYFLNFTLRDKGRVEYDWDQPWERSVPDQLAITDWAARATKLRNGIGRDYLIYGRMLQPWNVTNMTKRDYGYGKEPLVQSGTWQAADGRIAVVLANYADVYQSPRVTLEGRGKKHVIIYNDDQVQALELELPSVIDLRMPARSVGMIEVK